MSVATVGTTFGHLERWGGKHFDGLGVSEVVVHGDEPVAFDHEQGELLLDITLERKVTFFYPEKYFNFFLCLQSNLKVISKSERIIAKVFFSI